MFGLSLGKLAALIIVISALLLAWRNLRLRRGDRQGALRFAIAYFAIDATARLLMADYPAGFTNLIGAIWDAVKPSAAGAVLLYALYIALEPFARKKWPEQLISWTRLLAGRVRDPMVGRDVLIGVLAGLAHSAGTHGGRLLAPWLSRREVVPAFFVGPHMDGLRYALGSTLNRLLFGVAQGVTMIMILVLLTIILRKRALAAGALFLLMLTTFIPLAVGQRELIPFYVAVAAMLAFVVVRYGIVAFAATLTTFFVLFNASAETSPWLAGLSMIPVAFIVALALWAFRVSLGGQSLLPEGALGD